MKKYFLVLFLLIQSSLAFAVTEISMESDQGDYIGQGLTYNFNETTDVFNVTVSAGLLTINQSAIAGARGFTYSFSSSKGLSPGTYFNATRYPFQSSSNPGLSISGNGRGCNTLGGQFIIYEISVVNNKLENLALDFVQYCENGSAALQGSIRVNSSIASPSPFPVAFAGDNITLMENTVANLSATQSYDTDGSIVSYLWEQVSGQSVVIGNPNIVFTEFLIPPALALGGENFEFKLTVTDDTGNTSTDNIVVHGRSALDPYSFISMISDPGDYIGGGQTYDLNEDNGNFTTRVSSSNSISISYSGGSNDLSFDFSSPDRLTSGAYFDAKRLPFQGPTTAGLSVSGNGRGCNRLNGYFVIYEVSITDNVLDALALDFVQYCDSSSSALRGSVRINSRIPVPNPVPVAYAGKDLTIDEGALFTLDAQQSFSAGGIISRYLWQQTAGQDVVIVDNAASVLNLKAPDRVALGGESLEFTLTVTDANASQVSDKVNIEVRSKSDPKTYMIFNSQPGDYIGAGKDWFYSQDNATFKLSGNYAKGVNINVSSNEYWTLNFVASSDRALEVGRFLNATRFPFQDSTLNGLGISGDGRGCNQLSGQFEILQLTYVNNTPTQFAATFEQYCESSAAALTGEIYVNAYDPSVPVSSAGSDRTVFEGAAVTLNGSDSYDTDGSIISYLWTQLSGTSVVLSDNTDIRPSFKVPALGDRQLTSSLKFQLMVEDNLGFMSESFVVLTINVKNISPVANDFEVNVMFDTELSINFIENTSDEDGMINIASIDMFQSPGNGQITIKSDGTARYIPDAGFTGVDYLSYIVKDNDGAVSNIARVSIIVKDDVIVIQPDPDPLPDPQTDPEADPSANPAPTTPTPSSSSSGGALNYLLLSLLFLTFCMREVYLLSRAGK